MNPTFQRTASAALVFCGIVVGSFPAHAAEIEVRFVAQAGDAPLRCGTTHPNIGATRASVFLQDFRVYVSAFRLLTQDGREVPMALTPDPVWQSAEVALLDFEDASGNCNGNSATRDRVRGTVPDGEYKGIVFEVGVPFALNHQDPTLAGPPLNFSALTWPWAGGYKFTTIDLDTQPAGNPAPKKDSKASASATGFSIHLGSTECASSGPLVPPQAPCGNPNRPVYRFEKFDPARDVLVMDLGALLAGTDVTVNMPGSASGCMSSPQDDDCVGIMDRFGLTFRGAASAGQKFFRVERRP